MQRRGFTLIEIVVVITVIAILATLVAPNVFRHVGTARDATASAQIEMLGAALDAYRLDNGRYPSTQQGLAALMTTPVGEPRPRNWRGPYLRRDVPLDPWDNAYLYRSPGEANPNGFDQILVAVVDARTGKGVAVRVDRRRVNRRSPRRRPWNTLGCATQRYYRITMPTLTFKVTDREAARIRALARREGLTVSEFLRRRAVSAAASEPGAYRVTRDPITGLPVMEAPSAVGSVSSEQIRALLADFP